VPTVTATNLYHVGVLVEDLDAAMARFGEVLGLTFEEPRTLSLDDHAEVISKGERIGGELRVVYSVEGPPFLELIQAHDHGVWGRHHGEGLHHIGSWQEGLREKLEEMAAAGIATEATISIGEDLIAAYLEPTPVHQTRIELVGRRDSRPDVE